MKKRIVSLVFIVIIVFSLSSICVFANSDYSYNDLDYIDLYEIWVNPRKDGSLDMEYHIVWTVLDSYSDGPLSWVKIGIPNKYVNDIVSHSDCIYDIYYYSDEGSYIRIDLDRDYYKGESVDLRFSFNLTRMYHLYEDEVYFDFAPGYFENILVGKCNFYWNSNSVKNVNDDKSYYTEVDGYYLWSGFLYYGETYRINVTYNKDNFDELSSNKQYSNEYRTLGDYLAMIIPFAIVLAVIIYMVVSSYKKSDPYMKERGFISTRGLSRRLIMQMFMYGNYGTKVDSKGKRIENPNIVNGSSGGSHSSGGSCACACACACAGGGRAGCTKKDFYRPIIKTEDIINS